MSQLANDQKNQSGNALFLILIAVALFAALSYAITQSGRGSGTIDKEDVLIKSAQITQFMAGVRSTVTRMILTGSAASSLSFDSTDTSGNGIFSKTGGGIPYMKPPANIGNATDWGFSSLEHPTFGMYIKDVGTNTNIKGREAIGGLGDISLAVCQAINKQLGISGLPANNSATANANINTYTIGSNVLDAYPGRAFACVHTDGGSGVYLYYHALVEN